MPFPSPSLTLLPLKKNQGIEPNIRYLVALYHSPVIGYLGQEHNGVSPCVLSTQRGANMAQIAKNYAHQENEDPPACLGSQEPACFLSFNLSSLFQLQDVEMRK